MEAPKFHQDLRQLSTSIPRFSFVDMGGFESLVFYSRKNEDTFKTLPLLAYPCPLPIPSFRKRPVALKDGNLVDRERVSQREVIHGPTTGNIVGHHHESPLVSSGPSISNLPKRHLLLSFLVAHCFEEDRNRRQGSKRWLKVGTDRYPRVAHKGFIICDSWHSFSYCLLGKKAKNRFDDVNL